MPFLWDWIWKKLNGTSETPTQPQVLDEARVDDKVREEIVRDRRAVSAKKGNTSAKPRRVRSNNASKTSGKSAGKTVRAPATKGKAKGKTLPKG